MLDHFSQNHSQMSKKPDNEGGTISLLVDRAEVEKLLEQTLNIWKDCPNSFPVFNRKYSWMQKRKNESELDKFIESLSVDSCNNNYIPGETTNLEKYFLPIKNFLVKRLDFCEEGVSLLFSNKFLSVTSKFIKAVKEFDGNISSAEIFQACRNVWTMNWIQMLFGLKVELTPSVFAYSMLYPYTDNFLDSPDIPDERKKVFNQRLMERLCGNQIEPIEKIESVVYQLLDMIETEFPRYDYPAVFNSLITIHEAQIKSLQLADKDVLLSHEDRLKISLEKGGTSVLADGYLVAGDLSDAQKLFLFSYGGYLQLVDDLQDVNDDSLFGVKTYFTAKISTENLDVITNHICHFGRKIILLLKALEPEQIDIITSLMDRTNDLLIIDAVALCPGCYGRRYLKSIAKHSVFNNTFLKLRGKEFIDSAFNFMDKQPILSNDQGS